MRLLLLLSVHGGLLVVDLGCGGGGWGGVGGWVQKGERQKVVCIIALATLGTCRRGAEHDEAEIPAWAARSPGTGDALAITHPCPFSSFCAHPLRPLTHHLSP